jgi:predicted phage-related endonuclease
MNNNFDNLTFINKFNSENDFLEFRQGGIGGSDVAAIMNESPFKTAEDVWNSKKNDDNNYIKPLSKRQKDRMEQGKFFEPHIIKHFSDKNNLKPTKVSFAFFDKNFIHRRGNVDAIAAEGKNGNIVGIEAKTVLSKHKDSWMIHGIPKYYKWQCWYYGTLLGIEKWYVPVFFIYENSDSFKQDSNIEVSPDVFEFNIEEFGEKDILLKKIDTFWENIKNDIMIPSDRYLYEADKELTQSALKYRELSEKEKEIKLEKERVKSFILDEAKKILKEKNKKILDITNDLESLIKVTKVSKKSFDKIRFLKENPELVNKYNACQKTTEYFMLKT